LTDFQNYFAGALGSKLQLQKALVWHYLCQATAMLIARPPTSAAGGWMLTNERTN